MNIYLVYLRGEVVDVVAADFVRVVEKYPDADVQVWRNGRLRGEVLGKDLRELSRELTNGVELGIRLD